ncbi:MAG: L-lactate permease [Candidatus Aminicenantes bacterium]|nr:L-lactate permease [Candidatus Aminicenantes bacterium]
MVGSFCKENYAHGLCFDRPDRRVQVVIIAWLFGSFIEGSAGFGTPAAIAAPLMVALGFPALAAVMIGMMIQSTAVTFGACGTPILIGVKDGLQNPEVMAQLKAAGTGFDSYLQTITAHSALFGVALVIFAAKKNFLLPKDHWDFSPKSEWDPNMSTIQVPL